MISEIDELSGHSGSIQTVQSFLESSQAFFISMENSLIQDIQLTEQTTRGLVSQAVELARGELMEIIQQVDGAKDAVEESMQTRSLRTCLQTAVYD
jgi:hypothetical protein